MRTLKASLIQAGDNDKQEGETTITFKVSREDLAGWSLPLYRESVVTIQEPPADPLADHPQLALET